MITPSFNLTATERVLPKLALDFTTANLDSRITFTRTTDATHPATYVNSSGLVIAATNNQPRFDYDPVALTCKGLLIEESRVNSLSYSEEMQSWSQSGTVVVNQNATTAPDGNATADEIVGTLTSSNRRFQTIALTSGTTYSYSIFAKETSGSQPGFRILNAANTIVMRLDVLFTSGVPAFVTTTGATNPTIQQYSNGWYKISGTYTAAATENHSITIYPDRSGTQKTVYVWGAQFETGAFPTSYIPTTTTALTRNADVATMTGTNFSSWWTATTGGAQVTSIPKSNATVKPYLTFDDTTVLNSILMQSNTTNLELKITNIGIIQTTLDSGTIAVNSANKICSTWNTNSCASSGNATTPATTGLAIIPTPTQLRIGSDGTNYANAWIQKIYYWKQRIINAETQAFSK